MVIKRDITWRMGVIYFALMMLSFFVLGKVVYLQLFKDGLVESEIVKKDKEIEGNRGNILACDGRKLACSVPSYRIYMDMKADGLTNEVFKKNIDSLSICLARLFKDKSAAGYKQILVKAHKEGNRYLRVHNRRVSYTEFKKIKQFPIFRLGKNKGGFAPEQFDMRQKPFGILASRVIGKLYNEKEKGGMIGLEQSFNHELKGESGINTFSRISGQWIPQEVVAPQNGNDVMTSIDIDIQDVAENSLKQQLIRQDAHHGVAIVMEVETGAIKAMVNLHREREGYYVEDYFNYAIGEATEPGSTFKLASMIVALEDGAIKLDDYIDTGNGIVKFHDRTMRDSHHGGFGKITYREVFEKSSNVGISLMIVNNYNTNPKRFVDRLYSMGLNKRNGLEIRGEVDPYIKYPNPETWWGTSLPWISIGYESQLTPMQTLTFYNAVANNGKMMKPYFVTGIYRHGELIKKYEPTVLNPSICSSATVEKVQELLLGVVERGTATNLKNNNYKIAGKTGTAQMAKGSGGYKNGGVEYQASFAGYFPADNPKYSCIVMVNGPSKGTYYANVLAGSVFKQIADRVYAKGFDMRAEYIAPEPKEGVFPYSKGGKKEDLVTVFEEINVAFNSSHIEGGWLSTLAMDNKVSFSSKSFANGLVPNVKGMGAKDAVALLENVGLSVIVTGRGKVVEQSIAPGSRLHNGTKIFLKLG